MSPALNRPARDWVELCERLALGPLPEPPARCPQLEPMFERLLSEPRAPLGASLASLSAAALTWPGEGWLWRPEEGPEEGAAPEAWTPADPAAEATAWRRRAREWVWELGAPELFPQLEQALEPLLAARVAAQGERLRALCAPAEVCHERWLAHRDALPPALAARALPEGEAVCDTASLDPALAAEVGAAVAEARRGLVLIGDNASALRLLQGPYAGALQCAYLDPPYNTGSSGFAYRDRRPREAWLSFMDERLALCAPLLCPDGTLYAQIDQHEGARLRLLLDRHLEFVAEIIWRIGWVSGFKTQAKRFIRNHDTIYQFGRSKKPRFNKRYLPYPEGYRRRDGALPTGKGVPLEDTWNCSASDRLDSVQIMSFSREKVGRGDLTQKNEALLARMIEASSDPGEWILDPFLGSGTSAASALKLRRRFLGIERDPQIAEEVVVPRLSRVLSGDPYGISRETGWTGGGVVHVIRLGAEGSGRSGPVGGWPSP